MRVDRAVARAASHFTNMMTGKKSVSPSDFSPYDLAIEEENQPEVSFAEAVAAIQAAARKKE